MYTSNTPSSNLKTPVSKYYYNCTVKNYSSRNTNQDVGSRTTGIPFLNINSTSKLVAEQCNSETIELITFRIQDVSNHLRDSLPLSMNINFEYTTETGYGYSGIYKVVYGEYPNRKVFFQKPDGTFFEKNPYTSIADTNEVLGYNLIDGPVGLFLIESTGIVPKFVFRNCSEVISFNLSVEFNKFPTESEADYKNYVEVTPLYGQGNKTATALGKTEALYEPGFATDGTLIDKPNLSWTYAVLADTDTTILTVNTIVTSTDNSSTIYLDPSNLSNGKLWVNSLSADSTTIRAVSPYNFTVDGITRDSVVLYGTGNTVGFAYVATGTFILTDFPKEIQRASVYLTGGTNTDIDDAIPEKVNATTRGSVTTIKETSEIKVNEDGDIVYIGADNSELNVIVQLSIASGGASNVNYYIAVNGTIDVTTRQRRDHANNDYGHISLELIDTDADNGDVYSVYAAPIATNNLSLTTNDCNIIVYKD